MGMSVTAFMILVFGVCGVVVFVWWVMFKALTSKKTMHKGPVENATKSRRQTGHHPHAASHADDHHDDWHDDLHHETAAEAEWSQPEVMPTADDEIRRSWDESPSSVSDSGSYDSGSSSDSSSSDSGSSSSSD